MVVEFTVFIYGLLMSMVLSGASRNARLSRPNPPVMQYLGYLLCGASGGTSALLFGYAAWRGLLGG